MSVDVADDSGALSAPVEEERTRPGAPHGGDLENNAVFQILSRKRRRLARQRLGLVLGYAAAWVVAVSYYLDTIFGFAPRDATATALTLTLTHLIVMMNLFFAAGIEGYETNGWLKSHFADVIETGIPAEEIALGIFGATTRGYSAGWIRLFLFVCALGLAGLQLEFRLHSPEADFFVTWTALLGLFSAAALASAAGRLRFLTLRGTLRWYKGIRKSYENRLLELESPVAAGLFGSFRFVVFIAASIFVLAAPLAAYYSIGLFVELRFFQPAPADDLRLGIIAKMALLAILGGGIVGFAWGWVAEISAPRHFARLTAEVRQLFELRRRFIFERPR